VFVSRPCCHDTYLCLASGRFDHQIGYRFCLNSLKFATTELKAVKGLVIAVMAQNGLALKFATAELLADKGLVLAAVGRTGSR